jgi:hypothetical protein
MRKYSLKGLIRFGSLITKNGQRPEVTFCKSTTHPCNKQSICVFSHHPSLITLPTSLYTILLQPRSNSQCWKTDKTPLLSKNISCKDSMKIHSKKFPSRWSVRVIVWVSYKQLCVESCGCLSWLKEMDREKHYQSEQTHKAIYQSTVFIKPTPVPANTLLSKEYQLLQIVKSRTRPICGTIKRLQLSVEEDCACKMKRIKPG